MSPRLYLAIPLKKYPQYSVLSSLVSMLKLSMAWAYFPSDNACLPLHMNTSLSYWARTAHGKTNSARAMDSMNFFINFANIRKAGRRTNADA